MEELKNSRPRWWVLFGLLAVTVALFIKEAQVPVPIFEHKILEIVILLVFCGAVTLWLTFNPRSLLDL
jgi:hypothetical protein